MKIEKATWTTSADNVRLAMPLTKVDVEKRLVHGFASLDNADSHDDIVLAAASSRAFSRFRGNIREMHQPIAVGRMVDFREEEFIDKSGDLYRGIYVTVHVSRGAQDTWEKVLDGTLTGFSIGGNIIEAESQFVKDAGKNIRFIKDYELYELSLVDNPANQLANVFAFEKLSDGTQTIKGMIVDTKSENIFICNEDQIAKTSSEDSLDCPACGNAMANRGWFEYATDEEKTEKVSEAVRKYLSSNNTQDEPANDEGGVDVAKGTVKKDAGAGEVAPDVDPVDEAGKAESEVDSSVTEVEPVVEEPEAEQAADVSEVDNAEDDLAKMFDDLRDELKKSVDENFDNVNSTLESVTEKFAEFTKNVETKFAELEKTHGELSEKFAGLKEQLGKVEKSVDVLEGATAFKKSVDLGGDAEQVVQKTTNLWDGHFLSVDSLQD